jgi:regulator of replication initiation timing
MNVQRSPPSKADSNPELHNANQSDLDSYVTQRLKRKQPENEVANQLSDFRAEILGYFKNFSQTLTKLSDDISAIKAEVTEIKEGNKNLAQEQAKIKCDISKLETRCENIDDKVQCLEKDIKTLKTATPLSSMCSTSLCEEVITEFRDRCDREKNIVIFGVDEVSGGTATEQRAVDKEQAETITKTIYEDCPEPTWIFRIGRYNAEKKRPLKVCFGESSSAKYILRNKAKCSQNVRIYSDQTPAQQEHLKGLRNELKRRQDSGEEHLTIRYVKGNPKMTQEYLKNSKLPLSPKYTKKQK